jgi:tetratricopeptide (TPR) repeat protein
MKLKLTLLTLVVLVTTQLTIATVAGQTKSRARGNNKPAASESDPAATIAKRARARAEFQVTLTRFYQFRDVLKAKEGFLAAFQIDPTYPPPIYNLAVIAESEEDWANAAKWFAMYRSLDTSSPNSTRSESELTKIRSIEQLEQTPEGRLQFKVSTALNRAKVFLNSGLLSESLAAAKQAINLNSRSWEAHALCGLSYDKQGLFADAEAAFNKSLEFSPQDKKPKLEQLLQHATNGLKSRALAKEGADFLEAKEYDKASTSFTKAWSLLPENGDYGVAAALSLIMQGDRASEIAVLTLLESDENPEVVKRVKEIRLRLSNIK